MSVVPSVGVSRHFKLENGMVIDKPAAPCYVGGCSGQICSDQEGAVSTCEYKEEYACYKTATCARQASGQCGWIQTPALTVCLDDSK